MIKINLATMKQAASAGGADGTAPKRGDLIGTISQTIAGLLRRKGGGGLSEGGGIDKQLIRKVVLMAGVGFAASFLAEDYKQEELNKIEKVVAKVKTETGRLQAELEKTKGYEAMKKQLDADEFMIRTKVETMEKLVADRQTPPKLLLMVASTIPKDVWLMSFKVDGQDVLFNGGSVGFNPISDFMKALGENTYFYELNLQKTEQTRDAAGTELAVFDLQAKRKGEMFK